MKAAFFQLPPLILLAGVATALAGETSQDCASTYRALLHCVAQRAPQNVRARAISEEGKALPGQARELSNPTLSLQALKSTGNDPSGDSVQSSLLFALDLAGARAHRLRRAELESRERELDSEIQYRDTIRTTFLALHRIRQLRLLLALLQETEVSLAKQLHAFELRPKLSPEQEASKSSVELARTENQARIALLRQEADSLAHDIEIQLGAPWSPSDRLLPAVPTLWPELGPETGAADALESRKARVVSEKGDAQAELSRAEKRLQVLAGPAVEWSRIGAQQGLRAGALLQIPLPIMESYSGTRALSERAQDRARAEADKLLRESKGELDHNREIYRDSVEALKKLQPDDQSRGKIARIEILFSAGLISGASYLEALRQDYSLRQARQELELRALDSWCQIQSRQNRFESCLL